ncbi:MFS transporter [Clostridium sediminicola]|uniref:MFS transporter n=1 Tax=Clostridium sediminicola TaxID=3114879 RepID=UPI0031F1D457
MDKLRIGQYSIEYKKNFNRREISNFILAMLGALVSLFGTYIYTFAISLYVLKITGSGLSFATNLVLGIIPLIIFSPIAGVMADRFSKKVLVVLMDLMNGILLIGLFCISSIYGLNLTMIYVTTFIMTVFSTIFNISFDAAIPNLVSEKNLMKMNSANKIVGSAASILGPMIGGLVYGFIDIRVFIIINGISFVFSGISELFIDFKLNYINDRERESKKEISFIKDIKEGFGYIKTKKNIIGFINIFIALNFFIAYSISVPLPFIINNILMLEAGDYGIIQGAVSIGMILGALVIKRVSEKVELNNLLVLMSIVIALCLILIGIPVMLLHKIVVYNIIYVVYYFSIMLIIGVTISFVDIPIFYTLQKEISDEYRGRVLSIGLSFAKISQPIGFIISGFLINRTPAYLLPMTGGILLLGFNVMILKRSVLKFIQK